jgi:hypothetical protein
MSYVAGSAVIDKHTHTHTQRMTIVTLADTPRVSKKDCVLEHEMKIKALQR